MSFVERQAKKFGALVAAFVAATAAFMLCATVALGETVLDYDANRTENPIADNITRLNVNKLEKGARDYVKGAHMCIIEKETGRVVTEWVTDGSVHEIARNTGDKSSLDIDKVYILRELEAPEGYAKAADTEFVLHSNENFNTTGEIISGPDAEFDVISGHGDVQAFVINLYDEATANVETVEQRERTNENASSDEVTTGDKNTENRTETKTETKTETTTKTETAEQQLPRTSDDTPYGAMTGMAWVGIMCLAVGYYLYRRQQQEA